MSPTASKDNLQDTVDGCTYLIKEYLKEAAAINRKVERLRKRRLVLYNQRNQRTLDFNQEKE